MQINIEMIAIICLLRHIMRTVSKPSLSMRSAWRPVAVLACVLTFACDSAVAPDPVEDYQILFVNSEDGAQGQDIYRMNPDGSGRENLTRLSTVQFPTFVFAVEYRAIALAPDGLTIAFESTREACPGVWGMNVDGSGIRKLSIGDFQATRCNHFAIWSPNGNHIAFVTSREATWSIYVMNADGTSPRNVATSLDDAGGFFRPTGWSPDGRLVFQRSGPELPSQAYIVSSDGSNLQLLFGRTGDHSPEWSPDGSKVAFIRDTQSGSSLYVMNADGSNVRRLTDQPGRDVFWWGYFPNDYDRWSPDGRRIVFSNVIDNRAELRVIDADGTNNVRLTSYDAEFNGWAPDGRITFSSNVNGSQDLFLINRDGTGRANLTNTPTSHEIRGLWVRRQ